MAIFASLNPHISSAGQPTPTKFGTWVETPGLHFCAKATRDRANDFGAIDDEAMPEKRKMAIFASLNPHISCGGQPTPTKFGTMVKPPKLHFRTKASLDRGHQFGAIHGEFMSERRKMAIFCEFEPPYLGCGSTAPNQIWHVFYTTVCSPLGTFYARPSECYSAAREPTTKDRHREQYH